MQNAKIISAIETMQALGLGLGLHRRTARHFLPPVHELDELAFAAGDDRPGVRFAYGDFPEFPVLRIELGEPGVVADLGPALAWYLAGWTEVDDVDALVEAAIAAGRQLLADAAALRRHQAIVRRDLAIALRSRAERRGLPRRLWPKVPALPSCAA